MLIKELQSLGLDVKVLDKEENEIDLKQNFDGDEPSFSNADEEVFREVNDMDTAEGFSLEGEGIELENIAGDAAGSDAPEEDLFEEEEDVFEPDDMLDDYDD